jgi:hypothetical protein
MTPWARIGKFVHQAMNGDVRLCCEVPAVALLGPFAAPPHRTHSLANVSSSAMTGLDHANGMIACGAFVLDGYASTGLNGRKEASLREEKE